MRRPVRLGLVGVGRMSRLHAENLVRSPAVELVRIVDIVEETARAAGDELGLEWSTRYEDVLRDSEIEVVIVTPTALHTEMVQQASAAGKHVFCEKPLAFDLGRTVQAIEAAAVAGVKLQVGFQRRFDPSWAAAARRIRDGELGDVSSSAARCGTSAGRAWTTSRALAGSSRT
jgi:myo-inositol 2-dehydrogenase/D-chiro-inositol 1-dehydrogenase